MVKPLSEVIDQMPKPWFETLDFDIKVEIQYTDNGRPVKPYLSSFSVGVAVRYPRLSEAVITVFPRSGKLDLIYANSYNVVEAKAPIEYNGLVTNSSSVENTLDNMNIPEYLRRVLKVIIDNIHVYDDPLKLLSALKVVHDDVQGNNAPGDELSKVTQTIHIQGYITNKNDRKDIGKVEIYDYFTVTDNDETDYWDETNYWVSEKKFIVRKLSDGALMLVEKSGEKEEFNPTYQEIFNTIVPTKQEFEGLVWFVKYWINKGEVEEGDKNIIYY